MASNTLAHIAFIKQDTECLVTVRDTLLSQLISSKLRVQKATRFLENGKSGMIDPLDVLAFSIHGSPGIYALLLGSGISKSAGIPTGWKITLDLVKKLAVMKDGNCASAPDFNAEKWYREHYKNEPDYSKLLEELADTKTERQKLLNGYIEPSDQDEQGLKAPTKAHEAIAHLVAKDYIRIIITTNFDRLMERALTDAKVVPTVLSSKDQVDGMVPLIHAIRKSCVVFKVHGDYMDTRIRNTTKELAEYPDSFDKLLDSIFDEFGLIVCGWSGEWDQALRAAIERTKSRRFSHFWAIYGNPSENAKQLIKHRNAKEIPIENADEFFTTLKDRVEALESCARPHPYSTEVAVALIKRYLPQSEQRIRLDDLVDREVARIRNLRDATSHSTSDKADLTASLKKYEATCETLLAMAKEGGRWVEDWHHETWRQALEKLVTIDNIDNIDMNSDLTLKRYPATLLLYALGLGAAAKEEESGLCLLTKLLDTRVTRIRFQSRADLPNDVKWIEAGVLLPFFFLDVDLERQLRQRFHDNLYPSAYHFNNAFHRLNTPMFLHMKMSKERILKRLTLTGKKLHTSAEYLFETHFPHFWTMINSCDKSHPYQTEFKAALDTLRDIRSSLEKFGDASPYIKSNLLGHSAKECLKSIQVH